MAVLLLIFPDKKLFLPSVGRSKSHQHQLIFIFSPKNHNFIKQYHHFYQTTSNDKTKWQQGRQIHTCGKRQQEVDPLVEYGLNHHYLMVEQGTEVGEKSK
jgi:hypothetical protein